VLEKEGVGSIVFSRWRRDCFPTAISMEYQRSRAARDFSLKKKDVGEDKLVKIRALNEIARQRGQTLAEMAVAWVLRDPRVTSALVGASKVSQVDDNVAALKNLKFSAEELGTIDGVLAQ